MTEIDPRRYREAAGQYMTGVTVVTTLEGAGRPSGLTVNSFTSVSLHPPLVLFCLGRDSANLPAFEAGNGFVVHVLGADQVDLSIRFAAKGVERFEGIEWTPGVDGLPVIGGVLATFQCRRREVHDGGDHLIYLGEVLRLDIAEDRGPALCYFRGRYVASPETP